MRTSNVAESSRPSQFLTTADLARMLERTPRGARWIARQAALPYERTQSGQHLYQRDDARRLIDRRADQRFRGVTRLRVRKQGVPGEPHQLALFGGKLIRGESQFTTGGGSTSRAIAE